MKHEAKFTPQIIASFARAGVAGLYKIEDPSFGPTRRFASKRPCDFIGTLPNGRSLACEVKQHAVSPRTGLPMGFRVTAVKPHQRDYVKTVADHGGIGLIALVSWRYNHHWDLHLWRIGEWLDETEGATRSISAAKIGQRTSLRRQSEAEGWDLTHFVRVLCSPRLSNTC